MALEPAYDPDSIVQSYTDAGLIIEQRRWGPNKLAWLPDTYWLANAPGAFILSAGAGLSPAEAIASYRRKQAERSIDRIAA